MKLKQCLIFLFFPLVGFCQINSSLDLVGGLDYGYRFLHPGGSGDFGKTIIETRKNEQFKIGYRFGLNYNKRIKNNFHLRTGIRFVQGGYVVQRDEDLRWPSEFMNGVFVPDPDLPHKITMTNDFQFLEVPLVARWEWGPNNFNLFFEVGLAPSLYLKTIVKQKTDINPVTKESSYTGSFAPLQVSGLIATGVNYNLGTNTQIFAQPIIRGHITQLIYNVRVKEHLINMGLELGLRKRIN